MAELVASGLVFDHRGSAGGPRTRALDGVDLSIDAGDVVAVMGGTGAGKSTLARMLAGIQPPTVGHLTGSALGGVRLVLQRPESSFLEERVLDEVALAARAGGADRAGGERRARALLSLLGLPEDVADRDPLALSGGEQRRVAIAAVLAGDPRITILDEPGAGLDPAARAELHRAILSLREAGRTIVIVTHDPSEAALLATRLVVLVRGRVAWDGPVDPVLGHPAAAADVGLEVAPEISVLHQVADARGVALPPPSADPAVATRLLVDLVHRTTGAPTPVATSQTGGNEPVAAGAPERARSASAGDALLGYLPPRIDARLRIGACALAVAAALLASSLVGAGVVAAAAAVVVAMARIGSDRVRVAVRPLVGLAIALVALQLLVDPGADAPLLRGSAVDVPAAPAVLRSIQASAIVLATLALSASTSPVDLAAALRWWLAPLRLLRVPVDAAAFIVATGLGLVPVLADELERLRRAQRARGLRPPAGRTPVAALRADAKLLVPLVVGAFRHAHHLADALVLRGIDPEARVQSWRPRTTPRTDALLAVGGVALVALSRFA